MKVIRASVLGFCFGVRRAVNLVENALENSQGKQVYSLGPLIHNENALNELCKKGLQIINENELEKIPFESVVVIRAHGVSPSVIQFLEEKKSIIIDATCPRVKASQKMVERYTKQNDFVVLTGDKNHGEVIGIAGYAGKNFAQIQNVLEATQFEFSEQNTNVILLSQTTFSPTEFLQIEQILKSKIKNITVMNTICPATNERQNALLELCKKVDGVLIIGGKNSANTKRLFETAKHNCEFVAHIQSLNEIPKKFYDFETVGITAGASTPDNIIEEIEKEIKNNSENF